MTLQIALRSTATLCPNHGAFEYRREAMEIQGRLAGASSLFPEFSPEMFCELASIRHAGTNCAEPRRSLRGGFDWILERARDNINPLSHSMVTFDQAIWDPLLSTNLLQTVMNSESGSRV